MLVGGSGYLRVAEEEMAVQLLPSGLYASPRLCEAVRGHEPRLQHQLQHGAPAAAVLADLRDIAERRIGTSAREALPPAEFYERVIAELDGLGWSVLLSLSPALDEVELLQRDDAGREHAITMILPSEYPRLEPRTRTALPAPFEISWPRAATTGRPEYSLAAVMSQFKRELQKHQLLWDILDDFDANTWVLEPLHPTRDCVMRRIALSGNCSLQISLHVGAPTSLPELLFLGADRILRPLREALNSNLGVWSVQRGVRENLQDVLQTQFPSRPQTALGEGDAYTTECAICYNYRSLDDTVPECACDACGKPYHGTCLNEWLRSLPTTQQSFNRLFGECPYCSRPIAVEMFADRILG
ncbi:hypothetical protein AB1Y20_000307 [Prymnesium parvum]|uniref:RING-type domain-containing protein n=1 Tax=Prymnesium parvum TaxID=97485 RepID=A0AB34K5I3_PRYPA